MACMRFYIKMRWKCICSYDGTGFCGWQSQANRLAIQDILEERISSIFKCFIRIHGSSRTDAGVHARGQVFHFDADWKYDAECLLRAINSRLNPEIRILSVEQVDDHFHARFSNKGKRYCYYFQLCSPSPFDCRYVWNIPARNFNVECMQKVLPLFVGKHDFRGFAGKILPEENALKHLFSVQLLKKGSTFVLEVIGSGYLYRMVRMIMGAAVMCGYGKIDAAFIKHRLQLEEQNLKLPIVTAPARGLFLEEVFY